MSDCSLIACPICQKKLYAKADICPHCGFQIKKYIRKNKHAEFRKKIFGIPGTFANFLKQNTSLAKFLYYLLITVIFFVIAGSLITIALTVDLPQLLEDAGINIPHAYEILCMIVVTLFLFLYCFITRKDFSLLMRILQYIICTLTLAYVYYLCISCMLIK